MAVLITNANLVDTRSGTIKSDNNILIKDDKFIEVGDHHISSDTAQVIDLKGRYILPGLIDCHVHVAINEVHLGAMRSMPLTLMSAKASVCLRETIFRGYTTVRDTGGADYGLREAVRQALAISDHGYIMDRGQVVLSGSSQDLLNNKDMTDLYLGTAEHT